eukprot:15461136-Alexandrium_andersonii.AAC.1
MRRFFAQIPGLPKKAGTERGLKPRNCEIADSKSAAPQSAIRASLGSRHAAAQSQNSQRASGRSSTSSDDLHGVLDGSR